MENDRTDVGSQAREEEERDQAIMAADDTGMIAGERRITVVELEEGEAKP